MQTIIVDLDLEDNEESQLFRLLDKIEVLLNEYSSEW